jgi:hypothetical protein
MASEGIEAKTLTLKLKTTTFEVGVADVQRPWVLSKCSFAWGLTLPVFVGWELCIIFHSWLNSLATLTLDFRWIRTPP